MEGGLQQRVRDAMKAANLWVGASTPRTKDLSLLFFERAARFFLRRGGRIAFVMPLAAMTRGYAEKFRTGAFPQGKVRFLEAWTFDDRVFPLFPVRPAYCSPNARHRRGGIPDTVTGFAGLAARPLTQWAEGRRPPAAPGAGGGTAVAHLPGHDALSQRGSARVRPLCQECSAMSFAARRPGRPARFRGKPQVESGEGAWKSLPSLRGAVEREFIGRLS